MAVTKRWDETSQEWVQVGAAFKSPVVSDTPPENPDGSTLWVDLGDESIPVTADYAALDHDHAPVVLNSGHQSNRSSIFLPYESELAYWTERGNTAEESTTNCTISNGGFTTAAGLVQPHHVGNSYLNIDPDNSDGCSASFTYTGTFQSFSNGSGRRPWVRIRAGQNPSRLRVQTTHDGGSTWRNVHDETSPLISTDGVEGVWLGPTISANASPDGNIYSIDALRFVFDFSGGSACRLQSLGWYHPNINLCTYALASQY